VFVPAALVLVVSCASGGSGRTVFSRPGTYTASAQGVFGSPIKVVVSVDKSKILTIDSWHTETYGYGERAVTTLTDDILANQTVAVDVVTGATLTSFAFIGAVTEALEAAGGDMGTLRGPVSRPVYQDTTADVVVVGAGAAGFNAAITLAKGGKKVILIEKEGIPGGNTLRSSVSIQAAGSEIQKRNSPSVNPEQDVRNFATSLGAGSSGGIFDEYFRLVAANSKNLMNNINEVNNRLTRYRPNNNGILEHRSLAVADYDTPGPSVIRGLEATALKYGVDYRLNNRGVLLLNPNGNEAGPADDIGGIKVETKSGTYNIMAGAVVLATGGFERNQELKEANFGRNTANANPLYYATSPATSRHKNGDGHIMGRQVGAALDMMHEFSNNTSGLPGFDISNTPNGNLPHQDNFLSLSGPRGQGTVNINAATGRRFGTETAQGRPEFFGAATMEDARGKPPITYYAILPHKNIMSFAFVRNYYTSGLYVSAPTLSELADKIGFTGTVKTNFLDEMETVLMVAVDGAAAPAGFAPNGGFTPYRWDREGPFYAIRFVPALHGTYGGIRININAQVIRGTDSNAAPATLEEAALNNVIKGLYAAGTVSRPPRTASATVHTAGAWGFAAAQHILGNPSYDKSYWQ
jgi:succinate dehydrogenase/fumarate reductase flavoprotein subunit